MADDQKDKTPAPAPSDSKTAEQKAAQDAASKPGASAETKAASPAPQLSHGEPSKAQKAQEEEVKKTSQDPWGDTPVQMRDQHSPEVDPEKVDPLKNSTSAVNTRSTRVNPMEPGQTEEEPPQGGTNAPA